MDPAVDCSLQRGARVRLIGLSTQILNGAEGRIVDKPDASTGRFPVRLVSPQEAVAAYRDGVKVRPQNLVPLADAPLEQQAPHDEEDEEEHAEEHEKVEGADLMPPPAAWAAGLTRSQQQEWLVDCYRMRVDDDMCWGGGNLHGLYHPNHTPDSILLDFLLFCKLAVKHEVVPAGWDWQGFLKTAGGLLGFAFEKADAKEKYGGENAFHAFFGGRSLRTTAEVVYGESMMAMDKPKASAVAVRKQVRAAGSVSKLLSGGQLLADVGGVEPWTMLRAALQNVQ